MPTSYLSDTAPLADHEQPAALSLTSLCHRQERLLSATGDDDVMLVVASGHEDDDHEQGYRHRTDSDFIYLSGLRGPQLTLVIRRHQGVITRHLFKPNLDPQSLTWHGPSIDPRWQNLLEIWDIHDISTLKKQLKTWKRQHRLACLLKQKQHWQTLLGHKRDTWFDITPLIHRQRMVKDPDEIACLQQAIDATTHAFTTVIRNLSCHPHAHHETSLTGLLYRGISEKNCLEWAYPPIVAGGERSCILHYGYNQMPIQPSELVLMDVGARYLGYCADITRTLPISGSFDGAQRDLYSLVAQVQQAVISAIKPGVTLGELQDLAIHQLTSGLISLGLVKGPLNEAIEDRRYLPYYMHSIGHFLGIDTHDVHGPATTQMRHIPLEAGMVITVEPGLYCTTVPPQAHAYQDLGIRIEDDILVTEDGYHVLSTTLPRNLDEVSAWLNS